MNLKLFGLLSFLSIGFIVANDIEDDWAELYKNDKKKTVSKNRQSKNNQRRPQPQQPLCTPPSNNEKRRLLDYKELYNNFEKYQDLETLDGIDVDSDALSKEASEEIALFEEQENEKYMDAVKYGAATLACLMVLGVSYIPFQPFTEISIDTKAIIAGLGVAGCAVLSVGTVAKTCEYINCEQPLKARHVAIKKWLIKLKAAHASH